MSLAELSVRRFRVAWQGNVRECCVTYPFRETSIDICNKHFAFEVKLSLISRSVTEQQGLDILCLLIYPIYSLGLEYRGSFSVRSKALLVE